MVMLSVDRPRELKYNFGAMKMFKGMTQKSIPQVMKEAEESGLPFLDEEIFEIMLFCGLKSCDETVELKHIEGLLENANYMEVYMKMNEAIQEAFGFKQEKKKEESDKKK